MNSLKSQILSILTQNLFLLINFLLIVIHFSNLKKITSGKKFLKKSRAQSERILFFSERERNFVTEREISERVQV